MIFFSRKKKGERRQQYRVRVHEDLSVTPRFGEEYPKADLVDTSSRGAGLMVPAEEVERYQEGRTIELRFALSGHPRPVRTDATVRRVESVETAEGEVWLIGLEFLRLEKLYEQLDHDFWPYFNRREVYRVPQEAELYPVKLDSHKGPMAGYLHDISVRGFAVTVRRGPPMLLLPGHEASATFRIPDTEVEATFVGRLVHRQGLQETIQLGFLFDQEASPSFTANEDLISDHVMERQRQELRGGQ